MKKAAITTVTSLVLALFVGAVSAKSIGEIGVRELEEYIASHGQEPVQYILSKFEDHDVVILGEWHYVKDDPMLVQRLIPVLHKNGIGVLATEHARAEDQYLIDSLLSGEEYDESLAQRITFLGYVHWPFQEYVDIYRAAWESNRSRDVDTPAFRILGMHCSPDWSLVKTPEDSDNSSIMEAVYGGCHDEDWAQVVLDAVATGDKVLVFCGIHHGLTKYSQPVVIDGRFIRYDRSRAGNYIYDAIGDRVMTVYLHGPFPGFEGSNSPLVRPADGYIDRAMHGLGPGEYPVAFDVQGSPLAKIVLTDCIYKYGHEPFTLDQFCDGYVFTRPFSEFEAVTLIEDFVTEDNLEYARNQTPGLQNRDFSVGSYHEEFRRDLQGLVETWRGLALDSE